MSTKIAKKLPFTVLLAAHAYNGSLNLFTHSRLSVPLDEVTFVGLGKRGASVRTAMIEQGRLNAEAFMEKDPNLNAEKRAAASAFSHQTKKDQGALLKHLPIFGIKDGQKVILEQDHKFVKACIENGSLILDVLCYKMYEGATSKPETWMVVQLSNGKLYDIVARSGEPLLIAEARSDGSSKFGEIGIDEIYTPRPRPAQKVPFNQIRIGK